MTSWLVDSVLETFIRKTRWPGKTETRYWISAYWICALPFLVSRRAFHLEVEMRGDRVTAFCFGRSKRFGALARRIFNGAELQPTRQRKAPWSMRELSRAGVDMIAIETHPWLVNGLRQKGWIIVPEAVRWRGRLEDMPPRPPGRSLGQDLRKFARAEYTCETATSREAWGEFLHEMVFPYARYRHGDDGWIPTEAFTRSFSHAHSRIIFVQHHGRRVAAISVLLHDDQAWAPIIGVRQGNFELVKDGVLTAVYSFLIAWARSHGVRELDLGRTSSFCRSGLAFYKAKWGLRPEIEPLSPLVAIRLDSDRPALRKAFESDPIFVLGRRELEIFAGTAQLPSIS